MGAMPGIAMLVLTLTFPASTGVPSFVKATTKSFLPCFHWPDSLSRLTVTSLVLCVLIGFRSAATAAPRNAPITTSIARIEDSVRIRILLCSDVIDSTPCERAWLQCASRHIAFPAQLTIAEPVEDDGREQQHVGERAHYPSQHGRRERLHHLGARRRAPHDRQQTTDDGAHGHDFGSKPQEGSFGDRLEERAAGETAAERLTLSSDRFLQVDDHHHGGLHGSPKERDEADPDRHREVVAERGQEIDA